MKGRKKAGMFKQVLTQSDHLGCSKVDPDVEQETPIGHSRARSIVLQSVGEIKINPQLKKELITTP